MKLKLLIRITFLMGILTACKLPVITTKSEKIKVPDKYISSTDTSTIADFKWAVYFNDPYLISLIDTALSQNQELSILNQEISIDKNEIQARKGEYLPFLNLIGNFGSDRSGKYTWNGLSEEDLKANPEKGPLYIGDQKIAAQASWELDVWKKLRNAKKATTLRYLATTEGRNFAKTTLIAELASNYYELLALDNQLIVITRNIEIQKNALQFIKYEKEAAKVSQLAVNRFEAQLLNTINLQYEIKQQIIEKENQICFLIGRFPQPLIRSKVSFDSLQINMPQVGVPSQLLSRRPDIRQASYQLEASKLDIQVAKANFFPSVRISAGLGFEAFNPSFLIRPYSTLYNFAGDLISPLVNKNAIKATYSNASLKQIAAAFKYEQTILNAYREVLNDLNKIDNYGRSFNIKEKETEILSQSVSISNELFSSARADYIEVLLTQREALNCRLELIELKTKQLLAKVSIYRSLGGGWN